MFTTNTDLTRQLPIKIADYKFDLEHSAEFNQNYPNQLTLKILTGEKLTLAFPHETVFRIGSSVTANLKEAYEALVADNTIDGLGLQKRSFTKALENLCLKYGAVEFLSPDLSGQKVLSLSEADLPALSGGKVTESPKENPDAQNSKEHSATVESKDSELATDSKLSKLNSVANLLKTKLETLRSKISDSIKSSTYEGSLISRLVPKLSALTAAAAIFLLIPKNFNKETDQSEPKGNNTPVPERIAAKETQKKAVAEQSCPVSTTGVKAETPPAKTETVNPFFSVREFTPLASLSFNNSNKSISEIFDMSSAFSKAGNSSTEIQTNIPQPELKMTEISFSDFRKLSYYMSVGNNSRKNGHREFNKADQAAKQYFGISLSEAIKLYKENPNITFSAPEICKNFLSETLSSRHSRTEISGRLKTLKEKLSTAKTEAPVSTVNIPAEKLADYKEKPAEAHVPAESEAKRPANAPALEAPVPEQQQTSERIEKQEIPADISKTYNPQDNLQDQTQELHEVAAPYDLIKLFSKLATNNNANLDSKATYYVANIFDVSTTEFEAVVAHRNNKDNILVEVSSGLFSLISKMKEGASQQELRKAYDEINAQKIDWSKVDSMAKKPQTNSENQSAKTATRRSSSNTRQRSEQSGTAGSYDYKTESRSFEVLGGKLIDKTTATTEYAGETYTSRGLRVGPINVFEQGDGYFKLFGVGNNPREIPAQISREEVLTSFKPLETITTNEIMDSDRESNK